MAPTFPPKISFLMIVHQISRCVHQISRFDEYPLHPPEPKSPNPTSSSSRLVSLSALCSPARDLRSLARVARRLQLRVRGLPGLAIVLGCVHGDRRLQIYGSIQLQLRVRALLFDKASVSLFLRSSSSSSASAASSVDSAASNLNSAYLQLHGDDVYFSLEDFGFGLADGAQAQAQRKDSHSMELELISCLST
ncbi:hypothetical protein Scep_014905 [Stephania cephalantha]|uniref:Uncharacterized protein n=1 Tax=Stephania cephalantha TaxID=152367 RepID=A0AAP0J253_9MAGN